MQTDSKSALEYIEKFYKNDIPRLTFNTSFFDFTTDTSLHYLTFAYERRYSILLVHTNLLKFRMLLASLSNNLKRSIYIIRLFNAYFAGKIIKALLNI